MLEFRGLGLNIRQYRMDGSLVESTCEVWFMVEVFGAASSP